MTPQSQAHWPPTFTRRRVRRGGLVLVAALVCLLVVTAIFANMLRGPMSARRQLHVERDRRQTELLRQAGADRAALRLATEADYRSEIWNLPADAILGRSAGRVTIEASRAAADQPWLVRVVAEYPLGSDFSVRRSQSLQIPSPTTRLQE
jgi:hypothetical protein